MKSCKKLIIVLASSLTAVACMAEKTQQEKLGELLATLKQKAAKADAKEYKISVPTSTAAARGNQTQRATRSDVLWPATPEINPLSAISENMTAAAKETQDLSVLRRRLLQFVAIYPEHREEPLLKDLDNLLQNN